MAIPRDFEASSPIGVRLWSGLLAAVAACLLSLPAAAGPKLCMVAAALPFEEGDDRFELVESETALRFERAGFEIVPSEDVMAMIDRVDEAFGDIYDPLDGRVVPEQLDRFETELAHGFRDDLGCAARLRTSLGIVYASYAGFRANWDGVSRPVSSGERAALMILAGVNEYGWVQASSLWVELSDADGELIGFRSAGIEPHVQITMSRDRDKLPLDQWLRNDEYLQDAFEEAIGSAAEKMRDFGRPLGAIESDEFAWPTTP
ncbi:MAG: hypothetical protein AAGC67_11825 [Myxococcota bacterium]